MKSIDQIKSNELEMIEQRNLKSWATKMLRSRLFQEEF